MAGKLILIPNMSEENIWSIISDRLYTTMPESRRLWLDHVESYEEKEGSLIIYLSSDFYRLNAETNCKEIIENIAEDIRGEHITAKFMTSSSPSKTRKTVKPAAQKTGKSEAPASRNTTLNKAYSFDNFIPGDNSSFAFNAAKVIAQNPGTSYNPCLIYGGVGLGKTHLLQSIGNYIDQQNPRMKIIYVTAESFTNEFISAISANKAPSFKNKYRNVDVLLIDDIHFLQKKDQTQEELFHTFNELYDNHKQIVLTCDRPITELTDITDRLKTRFRKGLNVDLQPPAYETRVAIAMQKCRERNYVIDKKVLEYICQNIDTNIRDLEGVLTTLASFSSLVNKPVTIETVKEQLRNFVVSPAIKNNDISIDMIIKETANYFGIKDYDIKGKSRNKNISLARHISIYLADDLTPYSLSEIGKAMSGRDHTTVMHSINKIKSLSDVDDSIRSALSAIKENLLK